MEKPRGPVTLKVTCPLQAQTRLSGRDERRRQVLLLTTHHKQEGCERPALPCLASFPVPRIFHHLTAPIPP
ncbi:hypothetical protein E2C01_004723 [Portunus trituberculatus]|uniref:Uncharacterized protein n=1 Tax=Portunus trituberculatus TaxID=210409 RepID=A0A5B7CUP2_PORTR|nr:hypothetical protein [Portunus trituberculatus]